MNKVILSLNKQYQARTLTRNTAIALRALSGENMVELAKEYGLTKQRVGQIVKRYERNVKATKDTEMREGKCEP